MIDLNRHIQRCAKINSAVFDIVYDDMCENNDVKSIHAVVLASYLNEDGEPVLSTWVPAPLVSHVQQEDHLWYVTLSLTPSAMKYFVHTDQAINFECRIGGVVTQISFGTDQLISLNGLNGKELVDNHQFQYVIHEADTLFEHEPEPEEPVKKRPFLSIVKND